MKSDYLNRVSNARLRKAGAIVKNICILRNVYFAKYAQFLDDSLSQFTGLDDQRVRVSFVRTIIACHQTFPLLVEYLLPPLENIGSVGWRDVFAVMSVATQR